MAARSHTMLRDGRRLGSTEWGAACGDSVLYCPGAGTSSLLTFGERAAEELGLRMIGLDRPGLGRSDPMLGRTFADWVDDVRDFIAARDLRSPAIVGNSQGAPFGLACAVAGVVRAVAIVSGTDEIAAPQFAPRLPSDLAGWIEWVARDPAAAEDAFRSMSAERMYAMVLAGSDELDRAFYEAPAFAAAYRAALQEGFAQGPAGYARDTVLAMARWSFDVSTITVPVHLWYGRRDASPVHSPDHGEALSRRIPGAQRTVLDGGGAIAWTHDGVILAALRRALG